ncbi:heterokaryon incompatibility protein-domain-containing protein [Bisporella sp. PMI_857]|nr:heterokaryon incompatibility protein-domain-containing protein [Bisporella sp. PMI_857]
MPNIVRSAEQGCQTCSILCEGIARVSKSFVEQEELFSDWFCKSLLRIELRHDGPFIVELCPQDDEDTTYLLVAFFSLKDYEKLHPSLGRGEDLPLELHLQKCVSFVTHYIALCNRYHSSCSLTTSRLLPTRVLDVGVEGGSHDLKLIRLSTNEVKYIALSHCWGDSRSIITTTKNTLKWRQQNIEFNDLPRTFQDAVQITRALDIQYLWIDSLCIVQDDEGDWQTESEKMAEIYLGSYLTIAATGSADSSGGCFFRRWTCQSGGIKSDIETFELQRTFNGSKAVDNGHRRLYGYASRSTTMAPLLNRAWAYQERILAPRMLHFHMEEMLWECKACTLCECGYLAWEQQHKESGKWHAVELNLQLKIRIAQTAHDETPLRDAHQLWLDIVEEYSMLALTKESDRLPALAGLANFLSQKFQTPYLAGLWQDDLPIQLLWHRCSVMYSLCSRDLGSNIPTWSWASILRAPETTEESNQLNHITYDEVRDGIILDQRFKISSAKCEVAGRNAFGEVSSAIISVHGALIVTKYTFPHHQVRPQLQFGRERNDVHMDIWSPRETSEAVDGEMVFCLLFGMSKYDFAGHALILKPASANKYRRIGYLNLDSQCRWFDDVIPFTIDII